MDVKKIIHLTLCLAVGVTLVTPMTAMAEEDSAAPETVKVGFFAMDGYHEMDENGNKSGYGYDFLQLTRKYANLNYEYVGYDKSWEETQQMLLDGEIDLVTSAHKTADRMEKFDFSIPIGRDSVVLNTRVTENHLVSEDFTTYDGMTVGLLEGSSCNANLEEFARENDFTYEPKYYENYSMLRAALESGAVDAIATTSMRKMVNEKTLSEFDAEYFYVMVRKGDTELLDKINNAIRQLNSTEGDWKNTFYYNNYTADNYDTLEFTQEEQAFIERYSTGGEQLVVATDSDWKPFSWKEGDTYTGIIPDYFAACMDICGMNYVFDDSLENRNQITMEELEDVDLYICYSLRDNEAEKDLLASSALVENGTAYLQRKDTDEVGSVAIAASTPYLNTRLDVEDGVTVIEYDTTEEAKEAVLEGKVDAAFLYSYDAEYTVNQDKTGKLAFSILPNSSIAVRAVMGADQDHTLMSILMKCIAHMPDEEKSAIISNYVSFSATKMTLRDYVVMNPTAVVIAAVFLIFILFVLIFILVKNAAEHRHRRDLEGKVNEITGLNDQLKAKQGRLEETSVELEAQLDEITKLNEELEDRQVKIEEARAQAEAANDAKTSFLFNMSHDIRTPMNAILGFADLLEKHQDEPEKRADYLKKIQDSGTVLLSIINNVLEMARIEKGTVAVDEVAWSAEQFNDTLYSVFEEMMREKDIEFTRQIVVEHSYVYCDPTKLREVFINILSNAYKYTNSGGKVNMHLEELPCDREGYVLYRTTISDTGIGMSKEFLPHVFEEFSREHNTTDCKIEGTGLGMPIVKQLVDIMDGTIEVYSEQGKGSSFVVTIPHRLAVKDDLVERGSIEIDYSLFMGKRILLAEDNDLNAEIATEILREAGFAVDRAEDGQICVDKLNREEPGYYDLILMDVQMPNLNGYEAAKTIRNTLGEGKADIPILAMTANAFEEDKREAYRAGMNGHLAKPINIRELMKALAGILQ